MNTTLQNLITLAGKHAEMIMIDLHLPLVPSWVYLNKEGATVVGTPWGDNVEKKMMVMMLRRSMLQDKATAYSMVTEAWTASAPKGWDPETDEAIQAYKQPDRREVVIAFATDGSTIEWKRWAIRRDHLEMVTALEEEDFKPEKMDSWLTRLLNK